MIPLKVILCSCFLFHCALLFININVSTASITIFSAGSKKTFWKGCILQKLPLFTSQTNLKTPCHSCMMSRNSSLVVRRKGWPQRMYNCTEFCKRVTVCTHARYYNGKDKEPYPLCYHCQNKKNEDIKYTIKFHEEICTPECSNCSTYADLSKAFECAPVCRGLPTFCYPKSKILTNRVCYQADKWFGCDMVPADSNLTSSKKCKICAAEAKTEIEAQECAFDCGGYPTYYKIAKDGSEKLYSCEKPRKLEHADLFLYEIPKKLIHHLFFSKPSNIYLRDMLVQPEILSGTVNKFIFKPFNMTFLTYPRPPLFENKQK